MRRAHKMGAAGQSQVSQMPRTARKEEGFATAIEVHPDSVRKALMPAGLSIVTQTQPLA